MFKIFKKNKIEKSESEYRSEKKSERLKIEAEMKLCREMAIQSEIANIKVQLRQAAGLI